MKILMVLTSHDELGSTGRKTGFWLEEFAAPYFVFRDAGVELTLASPKGGQPPIASFEPGEDWFFDYEKGAMIEGVALLSPHSRPEDQPVPGPAGAVPANWESLLH